MRPPVSAFLLVFGSVFSVPASAADAAKFQGRTADQWAAMIGTPQGMAAMAALQSGDTVALAQIQKR